MHGRRGRPSIAVVLESRVQLDVTALPAPALSGREREVLESARLGLTNAEIAGRLGVTVHTVKFHLSSIYRKLGAANRTDAVVRWIGSPLR
jgi:NarL family two-component system response regulator YdfI